MDTTKKIDKINNCSGIRSSSLKKIMKNRSILHSKSPMTHYFLFIMKPYDYPFEILHTYLYTFDNY